MQVADRNSRRAWRNQECGVGRKVAITLHFRRKRQPACESPIFLQQERRQMEHRGILITLVRIGMPNQRIRRIGASRFAQSQSESHRRLAPTADAGC